MTTELKTLPSGDVQVRVCEDNLCATGWVTSHHRVEPKEAQLKESIRRAAYRAFIEAKASA